MEEGAKTIKAAYDIRELRGSLPTVPQVTEEEKLEVLIRIMVRKGFYDVLGRIVGGQDDSALKRILLDVIYPCPGGNT